MPSPSFERIDYSVRTNKNIERKMVFERLASLSSVFKFGDYRYVGLGSMWFVDFVMAHRLLGIEDLWSIEEANPERADFNRPFKCISVRPGSSNKVIREMADADWAKSLVVWLDYDSAFDDDAKDDCRRLLERITPGSVLIVTVNGTKGGYKPKGDPAAAKSINRLRELFGDAVPPTALSEGAADITADSFPEVLSSTILNFMTQAVRTSGRSTEGYPDRFVPLFRLRHLDGAHMVTVGGAVVSWRQLQPLEQLTNLNVDALLAGGWLLQDILDIVPITLKEKFALDRLLPSAEADFAAAFAASGIKLDQEQAVKYRRLYNRFPVFSEMAT